MSANVAIQCTIERQRPPGGVARVRCAEKNRGLRLPCFERSARHAYRPHIVYD